MGLSGPIIPCKVAAAGDERYLGAAVGSDVRPGFRWRPWVSASFAWQAWDHVHCQGVGCTPRGSAGVPGSPPLLRGRRGTMCTVKGSDVRPGVPLASLGLRLFAWQAWDGARNLVFFRAKWLQPAMKGTSCVRRLRLRSFGFFYVFCSNVVPVCIVLCVS